MRPPTWCPSCNAEVEPEQDFCMECGEPIAQARSVGEVTTPAPPPPAPPPTPALIPSSEKSAAVPPSERPTAKVKKVRRYEEPEAIRCPGCGIPSLKARCPGCGVKLRDEDA